LFPWMVDRLSEAELMRYVEALKEISDAAKAR
jgi:hypothetical protein